MMMTLLQEQARVAPTYFSLTLRQYCLRKGAVAAQLRNGNWVMVRYVPDTETDAGIGKFQCASGENWWSIDANSMKSHQLDIVYFPPDKEITISWMPTDRDIVALLRSTVAAYQAPTC